MKILVTGTAGFIGNFTALKLLEMKHEVVGIDNVNDYYDVNIKEDRLKRLHAWKTFKEERIDLADKDEMLRVFKDYHFDRIINLAAQAGVRHGFSKPRDYIDSNVMGFLNILEGSRYQNVKHLTYASTSSIYGANEDMPFKESTETSHPLSIYSASKKANEVMAHSYSYLFKFPSTGLRFFNVYGPWGRPDLAMSLFTKNILAGKPIDIFNYGKMERDFTYIDDIVDAIVKITIDTIPTIDPAWKAKNPDPSSSGVAPFKIYNIGATRPIKLMRYIEIIEQELGIKAKKNFMPIQPGEVVKTWANVDSLQKDTDYQPSISLESGIKKFIEWYKQYYNV